MALIIGSEERSNDDLSKTLATLRPYASMRHRQRRRIHRGDAVGPAGVSSARRIIIVGGGPAGVAAASAAKQQYAAADVVLINDEPHEPYEKPPLSKAVLTGKLLPQDTPIAGPKGIAATGVSLRRRAGGGDRSHRARAGDRAGERIGYDALVLATGSINRALPMFPAGQPASTTCAPRPRRARQGPPASKPVAARHRRRIDRPGGGCIGRGTRDQATVIEVAPRILARVCDEETSRSSPSAIARGASRFASASCCRRCAICRTGGSRW